MPFRIIAFALVGITLVFGLKPFNFISENDVLLNTETQSLVFNSRSPKSGGTLQGTAYTKEPLEFAESSELSILIELKSSGIPSGLGVFLTLEDARNQPPLILAQWKEHIAMRSRRLATSPEKPYAETGIRNCFLKEDFFSVLLSSDGSGTRVFIDGKLVDTHSWYHLKDPSGPFSGRLILGNNAHATQPWKGSLKRVALYNKAIKPDEIKRSDVSLIAEYSSFRDEKGSIVSGREVGPRLVVPDYYRPAVRDLFAQKSESEIVSQSNRRDIIINLVGFMPLGFTALFFSIKVQRRFGLLSSLVALGTVFATSFMIEFLQAYLPSRDSSQLDLLCNTIGGAFVIVIAAPILRRLTRGFQ